MSRKKQALSLLKQNKIPNPTLEFLVPRRVPSAQQYLQVNFSQVIEYLLKYNRIVPCDITALSVFGSNTICYYETKRFNSNFKKLRYLKKTNDVDVLVLLENKSKRKNYKTSAPGFVLEKVETDSSHVCDQIFTVENLVDVTCIKKKEYYNLIKKRNFNSYGFIDHITRYSVLVAGSFPFPLKSRNKIIWDSFLKPRFVPEIRVRG